MVVTGECLHDRGDPAAGVAFLASLPYIVTLVVVSSRGQALRPPAAAGEPWFKGQQT